jgi:mono/diheme cytochrome c family protein
LAAAGLLGLALLVPALGGAAPAEPRQAYIDNCSACHQPEGAGIQGIFPALAGDPFVKGDPTELVRTILAGRNGMPSFRNVLGDEELAAIVTHIRTSWGNGAQPATPAFIDEVRQKTNNQKLQTRDNNN